MVCDCSAKSAALRCPRATAPRSPALRSLASSYERRIASVACRRDCCSSPSVVKLRYSHNVAALMISALCREYSRDS
eukprot:6675689-Prymnesium_polylepis.2